MNVFKRQCANEGVGLLKREGVGGGRGGGGGGEKGGYTFLLTKSLDTSVYTAYDINPICFRPCCCTA